MRRNYLDFIFVHRQEAQLQVKIQSNEEKLQNGQVGQLDRVLQDDLNIFALEVLVLVGDCRQNPNHEDRTQDQLGDDVYDDDRVVNLGAGSGLDDISEFANENQKGGNEIYGDDNNQQKDQQDGDILELGHSLQVSEDWGRDRLAKCGWHWDKSICDFFLYNIIKLHFI